MPGKKSAGKIVKSVPVQYDHAKDVETLANGLIPKYHSHLVNCKIAYIFKNKPITAKGRGVAATAEKVSAKNNLLSGYHFVITVAYPTWKELSDEIKLAVIDHELEHCFVEDDEKTGETKYKILPHDVEEFGAVIKRHGLYTKDLARIGRVVEDALDGLKKDVVVTKVGKPEAEESEEDELDAMSRKALKKYIKANGLDISVKKSMSDDAIREEIREMREGGSGEQEFDEDEEFLAVEA
jgi:hypothetical protein